MLGIGTPIPLNAQRVAPLNPNQFSTRVDFWYDFTDLSTQTFSSGSIRAIDSKGNIDVSIQQLTQSLMPVAVIQNGFNSAKFDLSDTQFLNSISAFSNSADGVLVIVAELVDEGTQSVYGMATMRSPNVFSARFINNGANTTISRFTSGSTATDSQASSPVATNLNYSMYSVESSNNVLEAYYNGVAGASVSMSDAPITTAGTLSVGKSNTTSQYFNGYIFEIFYMNELLTATLKRNIDMYITSKYPIVQS